MQTLNATGRWLIGVLLLTLLSACGVENDGFTVTALADSGGSISPSTQTVNAGESATLTVTPDNGFSIDTVSGCDGSLVGNTYTTGAINADCTVTAVFSADEPPPSYTVTARAENGGSVTPQTQEVDEGKAAFFTVSPNTHFAIDTVSGCGGDLSYNADEDAYATGPITGDCDVVATFTRVSASVTASANTGGTITPVNTTVSIGGTTELTVTPDSGFVIDTIDGCGNSLSNNPGDTAYTTGPIQYSTGAITADCAVTANFAPLFTVTTIADPNDGGTVTPVNPMVKANATVDLTLSPEIGFELDSVSGCGGTRSSNTYTTDAIANHCTVIATFTPLSYSVTASVSGDGGNIAPANQTVSHGQTTEFTVTPVTGYVIDTISGCDGSLTGNTYTTGAITADCSITATFVQLFTVTTTVSNGSGGTISPATQAIIEGQVAEFTVDPDADFAIDSVSGCNNTASYNPSVGSYTIDPVVYITGPVTAECEVTASFVELFTVTTSAVGNGTIDPDVTVHKNGTVELTLTPDSGFEINAVSGCNGTRQGNTYTTDAITGDCTVTATFLPLVTVTASVSVGGTVSPATQAIIEGQVAEFTVDPDDNFAIDSVSGCNNTASYNPSVGSYTIDPVVYITGPITVECEVTASFVALFTVTTSAVGNGTIDPDVTVHENGTVELTVTPDSGFVIDTIDGCGNSLSNDPNDAAYTTGPIQYTAGPVTADCAVTANFAPLFTVTTIASPNNGGTVTPVNPMVKADATVGFTVTPASGSAIDTVSGCGDDLSYDMGTNTYITGPITANCTVTATFLPLVTVTASASVGGTVTPATQAIIEGGLAEFTVDPDADFAIDSVSGCNNAVSYSPSVGSYVIDPVVYTTGPITAECEVAASFIELFTVSTSVVGGGTIDPNITIHKNGTVELTVTPDSGFAINNVEGCGGSLSGNTYTTGPITADCSITATFVQLFTVTTTLSSGGTISPATQVVVAGEVAEFTVDPDADFAIDSVSGCNNTVLFNPSIGSYVIDPVVYTTGPITAECAVTASFIELFTVSTSAIGGGTITPGETVHKGGTVDFTVTPDNGFEIDTVSGCDGTLLGNTYTLTAMENCSVTANFKLNAPTPTLSFAPVKLLHFEWATNPAATHYRLLENPDGMLGFTQVGDDINPGEQVYDHQVPLYARVNAEYILQSCVNNDCYNSNTVTVSGTLSNSIGYFKASNSGSQDWFGAAVSLSGTGDTLAVGAYFEDSNATGIDGDQLNDDAMRAGAVYVFTRNDDGTWGQQAYIKASNTDAGDFFGISLSLNGSGDTLAVGAYAERSNATGIDGDQLNNNAASSGAVYVFVRSGNTWSQQAYIKASNTGSSDQFGRSLSLDSPGDTLAVGAEGEDNATTGTGFDGSQDDDCGATTEVNCAHYAGAVYVFARNGTSWSQQAYIKASNAHSDAGFGHSLSLNGAGNTLAVGAYLEDNAATGIDGDEDYDCPTNDNCIPNSGAAYVFTFNGTTWSQQAYIKASNTGNGDRFGASVSLDSTGDTLAVSADSEDSAATGIDGDQHNDDGINSGAVYVFTRNGITWSQQAYIKASNAGFSDAFGSSVSLDSTGDSLVVGAIGEDSNATGFENGQDNNSSSSSGAVYLFTRDDDTWSQQAYIKASNTDRDDFFGWSVSINDTGDTLAVGARDEDSAATGINGDQGNATCTNCSQFGAVYLY